MQAGLDRVDSENSDLVEWTEQMRASCFISDAPCRALSDADQQKKPGEEERGAQGTADEGRQGAQTQPPDSHKVPFICYFAMATLLSIKTAGQGQAAGATVETDTHSGQMECKCGHALGKVSFPLDQRFFHRAGMCVWTCCGASWEESKCRMSGFGAPAAGPQIGSTVTAISGVAGAPAGHLSLAFSAGERLKIVQVMRWQNAWYATSTAFTTLWFPLSSTDWRDGGVVAAAHSGGGTVASGVGAAGTSNPTNPVKWRKRIDEAVKSAMLPEVKSSLSALQKYLEDRRADDFDEELFVSQLAASLSRLSIVTLHLLKLVPLAALSVSDCSGVAELRGHGARDDEASFRSLMSLALRLMIRKHKEPLINEILQLDTSSARQSLPEVKIDRFQALKDAGDKLQHTVIAQIQRQLGLNAIAMRGDRWWKVSFVGMQVDKNEAAQDDDPEFENFAKANRMQKCPRCSAWVQKTDGCDAMHCLCNQVFCYICAGVLKEGTGIKQCKCPGAVSSL